VAGDVFACPPQPLSIAPINNHRRDMTGDHRPTRLWISLQIDKNGGSRRRYTENGLGRGTAKKSDVLRSGLHSVPGPGQPHLILGEFAT
jgi:hypothetical protein